MRRRLVVVVVLVLVWTMVGAAPGSATSGGDNGRITYTEIEVLSLEPVTLNWNLATVLPDGSDSSLLVSGPGLRRDAAWSPDGTRLAFSFTTDPATGWDFEVFVVDADGSNPTRLTWGSTASDVGDWYGSFSPSWSPDGRKIVFGSGGRILVMNADGSDVEVLTEPGSFDPAWSPMGDEIVVERTDDEQTEPGHEALYVLDVDGSGERFLANGFDADWSPDGRWVVFAQTFIPGIYVVPADGSAEPERITTFGRNPVWSPDGFRIAFVDSGAVEDIWVVSPDGSGLVSLGVGSVPPYEGISWQPVAPEPVGLVDPVSGVWRLRDGSGWVDEFFYGNPGDVPFMGDWDCDGTDTPGLYRQSDGFVYLRNSNSQGVADVRFFLGNPGDVPLAGDFDGDGCDTVSVYRPSQQRFYVIDRLGQDDGGLGAADSSFAFGNPGDQPVVGDWDGDGMDEIGLYRESAGLFYYRTTLTTGVAEGEFSFGNPGDRFISGDFGARDGVDTPGVYRPGQSRFYFRHTLTQGPTDRYFTWGDPTWIPVTGDFTLP